MASTLSKDFDEFLIQRIDNALMSLNGNNEYRNLKHEASQAMDSLKRRLGPLPKDFDDMAEEADNARRNVIEYETATVYMQGFRDGLRLLIGA